MTMRLNILLIILFWLILISPFAGCNTTFSPDEVFSPVIHT